MDTCINIIREVMDAFSPINMNHGGLISNMCVNSIPITGKKAERIHVAFAAVSPTGETIMINKSGPGRYLGHPMGQQRRLIASDGIEPTLSKSNDRALR